MAPAQTYTNLSGHPITLDDGTVVAVGEDVDAGLLAGPLAKAEIESGRLVPLATEETTRQSDVDFAERHRPPDYAAMSVDELRAELESRNLLTDGKKSELVARLQDSDGPGGEA